jgi:hypothetical protein
MRRGAWRRAAEVAAGLALLYFVGAYLLRHWGEIRSYPWRIAAAPLAGSAALYAVALGVGCWIWLVILRAMGERLAAREAPFVYFVPALARYIPGKVWQVSSMFYLAQRRGVDALHALAASVLLQLLVVALGTLVFVALLPTQAVAVTGPRGEILVVAAALVLVVLYLSPAFDHLYERLLHLFKRPLPSARLGVPLKLLLGLGALFLWLLWGGSLWLFLKATIGSAPPFVATIGIGAAGYIGGFLAFFSPGGLGVRESLYAVLLAPWLPAPVALAAALLNRVVLTLVEVLLTLLAAVVSGRPRPVGAGGAPSPTAADV